MYTLGINLSHHSSISLLCDNEVLLFLQEERLNREKYYQGIPYKSLDLIKNYTSSINFLSVAGGDKLKIELIVKYLADQRVKVEKYKVQNSYHHLHHAAAAFYMSPFDKAAIVVVDGAGACYPFINRQWMEKASETTSIYRATFPNKLQCLHKKFVVGLYGGSQHPLTVHDRDIFKKRFGGTPVSITNQIDIGWKYASVTMRIGFGVFGEGKTMGLSGYHETNSNSDTYSPTSIRLAYDIQKKLEEAYVSLVSRLPDINIVLGGGCALNILSNSNIKRTFPHLNIFVDPVAADSTNALGAAAYHYYTTSGDTNKLLFNPYRGPSSIINKNYIYECARTYSI